MSLPVAAVIVLLLLVVWAIIRIRRSPGREPANVPNPVSMKSTPFHAVSIKFDSNACKAARDLKGRRFLSDAAPKLPLSDCPVLECNCRFVHHQDRRAGKDRRSPFGPASGLSAATGTHEEEQRKGRDRRSDDDDRF